MINVGGNPMTSNTTIIDTTNQKILINYFEKTVGTPEDASTYELVLYTYSSSELLLEEYDNSKRKQWIVPYEAYTKALKVCENFHLKELSNLKGAGLDGKYYVIKFREKESEETLIRFTIDNVGREQTMMMFPMMKDTLSSYIR